MNSTKKKFCSREGCFNSLNSGRKFCSSECYWASMKGRTQPKELNEKRSKTLKGKKKGPMSEKHKEKLRQAHLKPREIRICTLPACENTFVCAVNSTRKYCCHKHSTEHSGKLRSGKILVSREVRNCANPLCENTFKCRPKSRKRYCGNSCSTIVQMSSEKSKEISRQNLKKALEASIRLWNIPSEKARRIKKVIKAVQLRPNKQEKQLIWFLNNLFPKEYKYVGDGEVIIAGKNPDFINVNGQKKIIELFGDYWHNRSEVQPREDLFSQFGYQTLVVWASELAHPFQLKEKLYKFHNKKKGLLL